MHKSDWLMIRVLQDDGQKKIYRLDESGRLLDKLPKNKRRQLKVEFERQQLGRLVEQNNRPDVPEQERTFAPENTGDDIWSWDPYIPPGDGI